MKKTHNLSLVFFLVGKKLRKNKWIFFSQLYEHLETPGDVELNPFISIGLYFLFSEHKLNDMLTVSELFIYNQEVFLKWIIFANYN